MIKIITAFRKHVVKDNCQPNDFEIIRPLENTISPGSLKCFLPLVCLYLTVKLITILTIYKIVTIGSLTFSASALIMPVWFFIGDVISEIYGYRTMKYVIWCVLFAQFIFAAICWTAIQLPSPTTFHHQEAYLHVLGSLPRVVFSSFVAIFLGAFVNSYLLSKWKIMMKGKFFVARSFASTSIGEFIFTITAYSLEFFGKTPLQQIFSLFIISYAVKILINIFSGFPAYLITRYIKNVEGNEYIDHHLELNPFTLSR